MSFTSDAADQVVRISLTAGEEVLKITGKGALEAARLLMGVLKNRDRTPTHGRTGLESLLRSGAELRIFTLPDTDLRTFCREAGRYGVLFTVLKDRRKNDGITDVLVRREDAAKVERIIERYGLGKPAASPAQATLTEDPSLTQPQKEEIYAEQILAREIREEDPANPGIRPDGLLRPSGRNSGRQPGTRDPSERPSVRRLLQEITQSRTQVRHAPRRGTRVTVRHAKPERRGR